MELSTLDYALLIVFFLYCFIYRIYVSKKSGRKFFEYFLSGRTCHGGFSAFPWWHNLFYGTSPQLGFDIVRTNGVSGLGRWAFLLTGLLTVFCLAKLWRKSNVSTDLEL